MCLSTSSPIICVCFPAKPHMICLCLSVQGSYNAHVTSKMPVEHCPSPCWPSSAGRTRRYRCRLCRCNSEFARLDWSCSGWFVASSILKLSISTDKLRMYQSGPQIEICVNILTHTHTHTTNWVRVKFPVYIRVCVYMYIYTYLQLQYSQ